MEPDFFRIKPGVAFDLSALQTDFTDGFKHKDEAKQAFDKNVKKLAELQEKLYASDKYALLIILQGMDASGKDGVIKNVMKGVNPQGCSVVPFKQPSSEELDHDFLWRHQKALPSRGQIGIFNRSHYEEVIVVKVHPEFLKSQKLPEQLLHDNDFWKKRYQSINDWEQHLFENGIITLKFFLHVSKEEQKVRFLQRIEKPNKRWKFSMNDVTERSFWENYMNAYQEALAATSTANSPWYVIPADKKWFTRLAVSEIIINRLEALELDFPNPGQALEAELAEAKQILLNEEN
ncbi:MAG TPA: polyphosphate kinase 2 family protein [Pyrinomonadaceae bacterium]|nr:polyphosphate kinase 2 family protein [Pyrinomonadaceae bacterium]